MLKDITFGQYFERDSFIHKLDPRTKLLLLILVIVFIFVSGGWIQLGIMAFFILSIAVLSKVPVKLYLKNILSVESEGFI